MGSDHSRSRLRRGKTPIRAADFSAEEALRGLPSRLVINLARLAGATLPDLSVTLQLMPFADRAIMKAYGLVSIGPKDKDGNRSLAAEPFCLEVIATAAELIASVVDPADVAEGPACFSDLAGSEQPRGGDAQSSHSPAPGHQKPRPPVLGLGERGFVR